MAGVILAALVTLTSCWAALWLGPRLGFVDRPDDPSLKVHTRPAVPLGGVGIFLGFHIAAATRDALDGPLLAASGLVLVLGLVDDHRGLPPLARIVVEGAAGVVLVAGGSSDQGVAVVVVGVLLVVLAINAVNLMDGLDGLAGSVALVTAVGITWLASGRSLETAGGYELAAAVGGFLILNWHPARVFLGDSGAYVAGLLLAHLMLEASPGGVGELLVAATLLGVFLVELAATVLRRVLGAEPLHRGDRDHTYDVMRSRGMPVPLVVVLMASAQVVVAAAIVAADRNLDPWQSLLVAGTLLAAALGGLGVAGLLRVRQS